jgi:uncharacterized membrane protein
VDLGAGILRILLKLKGMTYIGRFLGLGSTMGLTDPDRSFSQFIHSSWDFM